MNLQCDEITLALILDIFVHCRLIITPLFLPLYNYLYDSISSHSMGCFFLFLTQPSHPVKYNRASFSRLTAMGVFLPRARWGRSVGPSGRGASLPAAAHHHLVAANHREAEPPRGFGGQAPSTSSHIEGDREVVPGDRCRTCLPCCAAHGA